MYIKSITKHWNDRLGMFPVSLFIELDTNGENIDVVKMYEDIPDEPRDIIFYTKTTSELPMLMFLTSALMQTQYHVSIACNSTIFPSVHLIPRHRLILYCDTNFIKNRLSMVSGVLGKNDILILDLNSVRELKIIRKQLLEFEAQCQIMFDANTFDPKDILDAEIYDILPFIGDNGIFI